MLLPNLKDFLLRIGDPHVADLIERADNVLERYQINRHYTELDQVMSIEDTMESSSLLDSIVDIYRSVLIDTIAIHAIETNTTDIDILIDILEGILLVQNSDQTEFIIDVIESDLDNEEKLAEILMLMTSRDMTRFLEVFVSVNSTFFEVLKRFIEPDLNTMAEDSYQIHGDIQQRVRWWISRYPNSLASTLVRNNVLVGSDAKVYVNYLEESRLNELQSNLELFATELLGLVMLSGVENGQLHNKTNELFDELLSNISQITKADSYLGKILLEYTNG